MRGSWWCAAAFLLAAALPLRADDLPLDAQIHVHLDAETHPVDAGSYGKGKEATTTPTFSATLSNTGMDDLSDIGLKLYVVATKNWVEKQENKQEVRVVQVLSKEQLKIPGLQSIDFDLGKVPITSKTTLDAAKLTVWFSGETYTGYVVEIYQGAKLASVKVNGNTAVRRAYEGYLTENKGDEAKK